MDDMTKNMICAGKQKCPFRRLLTAEGGNALILFERSLKRTAFADIDGY